jgi:hypothetical protein
MWQYMLQDICVRQGAAIKRCCYAHRADDFLVFDLFNPPGLFADDNLIACARNLEMYTHQ